jgi:glycolate oxidase FAD binding subunit
VAHTSSCVDDLRLLLGADFVGEREGNAVASPQTPEEVAAVTRYANNHKLAIEIVGAGTKRGWGNPVAADILLETARLVGVREHSWQDLTATVAAGTPWSAMQQTLAIHKQQVALDPLWPETATIGGIIATNDSGALRLKYGSLRDLIIGMTIVLADGTTAKSGGKVVKNVAGYDLHKLMTGAFGTLGVITEVTFRLHPIPQHAETFTIPAAAATPLAPLLQSIAQSHLLTQTLQLRSDADGFHLDIQLSAHPDARHREALQSMTRTAGLELEPTSDSVWKASEALLSRPDRLLLKATMLPTEVATFAQEVEEKGGECVAQSLGILCASFPADELSFKLAEEFRYHVGLQGGTTSLLTRTPSSSSTERSSPAVEDELPSGFALMREIKYRFDPNRTLNPGRFMGGI